MTGRAMTASETASSPSDGDFVLSFARGLAVLRAFDGDHPRLTLSEAAERAEVPRAAARRFLLTLEHLGYVRSTGREFSLTPRVLELGFSYLSALSLPEIVQPHLEQLSREVDESASVAVLDGADIVYVARVPTRRVLQVGITIGTRFPAYVTSMGRVLLAGLAPQARSAVLHESPLSALTSQTLTDPSDLERVIAEAGERGWVITDGELEEGMRSVAAPLRGKDGTVLAAINVSASTARVSSEQMRDEFVPAVLRHAARIESELRLV